MRRAKIVLTAWRRQANAEIDRDLGVYVGHRPHIAEPVPPGADARSVRRPRPGRPPVYGTEDQLLIVGPVTGQAPDLLAAPRQLRLRNDLAEKITTFIQIYNRTAKPCRWTYDASSSRPHDPPTTFCGAALV